MSKMSQLMMSIEEDLQEGLLSDKHIAEKYEVPYSWVRFAAKTLHLDELTNYEQFQDNIRNTGGNHGKRQVQEFVERS